MTTFSTNSKDANFAPFMLAFTTNIDTSTCPSNSISFEGFANDISGTYNTADRVTSKITIPF